MAQKDIEQWAKMLQEAEAEEKAYERACDEAAEEAKQSLDDAELDAEDEVIDPASLGFIDSEEDVTEDDMLAGRPHNNHVAVAEDDEVADDRVDLAECGFTEDGEELKEKEAEEDLSEALHSDDDQASLELEIFDAGDSTGAGFAKEL